MSEALGDVKKEANQVALTISEEEDYVCPITHEVPKDPVVASDGYTYERVAIEAWLLRCEISDKFTSPITREVIEPTVYPNRLARKELPVKEEKPDETTLHGLITDLHILKKTLHEKVTQISAIQDEYERLQYLNQEMSWQLSYHRDIRADRIKEECRAGKTRRLFLKTLTGVTYTFDLIFDKHTVDDLADVYSQKAEIPAHMRIRLIFAGRQLEYGRTISSYNIQHESTLHHVLNLRGD